MNFNRGQKKIKNADIRDMNTGRAKGIRRTVRNVSSVVFQLRLLTLLQKKVTISGRAPPRFIGKTGRSDAERKKRTQARTTDPT
jgi:hypothetical protein